MCSLRRLYGLDAKRLREGGQLLIQGEGELGAALFEASTGTAGIQAMLATLTNDAKHYYAVGGKNMLLNEAARQLDEAQQRYKGYYRRPLEQMRAAERAQQQLCARLRNAYALSTPGWSVDARCRTTAARFG